MDALCFKTTTLLRRLTMPEARKLPVQEISYEKLMAVLGLTHDEFVDLCILMGCDYVPNIRGIGPKKAFELIKFGSKFKGQIGSLFRSKSVLIWKPKIPAIIQIV